MNSRRIDLMYMLLNSNIWLSGKELGDSLNVSDRTIRSDIKALNKLLTHQGIQIDSESNRGYFISIAHKKKFWEVKEQIEWLEDESPIPKTPDDRQLYILYRLLFSEDYLTMELLADELYVSKTTIYLDIKKIVDQKELKEKLLFNISNLKGLSLQGSEIDKRLFMSSLFKEEDRYRLTFGKSFYYALGIEEDVVENDLMTICEVLINTLNKYECSMVDKDLILLSKEIYVSYLRQKHGYPLEMGALRQQIILQIVHDLSDTIEKKLECCFQIIDRKYIQFCFNSKRLLALGSNIGEDTNEDEYIVDKFIETIYHKYDINLNQSENFRRKMLLHMGPMLLRVRAKIEDKSTIVDQIKSKYPYAYELSTKISPIIYQVTGSKINESELVYITLHVEVALNDILTKQNILVVCGSGFATAKLIKSELMSRYHPYINRIRHISYMEYENLLSVEEDLIVSTVPLSRTLKNKSYILVNPILTYQDIENLDGVIKNKFDSKKQMEESIRKFFPKKLFKRFEGTCSFEEAVYAMTKMLYREEYIENTDQFFESVIQRENLYSTVLPYGIAIPHPMESMSKTSVVSTYIFEEYVQKGQEQVKVILLFSINSSEKEALNELYRYLKLIVKNEKLIKSLQKIHCYEEFVKLIVKEGIQ